MQLPVELNFLEEFICTDYENQFTKADWLKSPFESDVWIYNFGFKKDKELNWNVPLYDGSMCSGQQILATVLEVNQYNRSDSLGVNPPLYW